MADKYSNPESPFNQARRNWLLKALEVGLIGAGAMAVAPVSARLFSPRPQPVQPNRNFFRIEGDVRVNGQTATLDTPVRAGDAVETGPGSLAYFAVGQDAYLLRANAQLRILRPQPRSQTSELIEEGIELLKGAALFVFGRREEQRVRVSTPFATVGIRGTGLYLDAEPNRTYVCLCYGTADLEVAADSAYNEFLESTHHDMPKYVNAEGATDLVEDAPFKDHSDLELAVLEDLVGRTVPFPVDEYYDAPRRQDY
ncbi:MAG: FecR domain-containing protein [Gammaproteobacteria bacterium]